MRFKLPISVFVAVILTFSILVSSATSAIADDSGGKNCIYLYSDVPKWAKEQYGPKIIGLNVISGTYKLSSGMEPWAGSKLSVLEEWLTFDPGLLINVGEGGVTLRGLSYPNGAILLIDKDKKLIQSSK